MSRRAMLMQALGATPRDLARMLRRVDDTAGRACPLPGGWCIAEVVAHMGLAEQGYQALLRRTLAEDNPTAPAITPGTGEQNGQPLAGLVAAFEVRRAETVALLSGLEQHKWGRPLIYAPVGPTRLRELVQALVAHDNEHLEQIATLRDLL